MSPLVSVYCLVYNHEKYLRQTLEGFVQQQTDFPFEIIIHDDASTDHSADIIREYCSKYPQLFVPIFQTENQYSKGMGIFLTYVKPLCKGKYIAICEGDDYWCNPNKLQKQVDYMESHPDCSMCTHDTQLMDVNGTLLDKYVNGLEKDRDYHINDVIKADGGGLFQASSILGKHHIVSDRPEHLRIKGIGDYPMAIYAGLSGSIHYMGEVMSCYRVGHPNSFVTKMRSSTSVLEKRYQSELQDLARIDKSLDYRYTKAFSIARGQRLSVLYRKVYGLQKLLQHPQDIPLVLKALAYRCYFRARRLLLDKLHSK